MDDSTDNSTADSIEVVTVRTLAHAQPFTDEEAAEFRTEAEKHDSL